MGNLSRGTSTGLLPVQPIAATWDVQLRENDADDLSGRVRTASPGYAETLLSLSGLRSGDVGPVRKSSQP